MIASVFAHLAVIYVPALQWVFRTVPLSMMEWGEILLVSTMIIIAVEIDKSIRKPKSHTKGESNYETQRVS
jgi:Ca2+-transporting ATPase